MKILVLCNQGNVRSACLAREIKDLNGALHSTDKEIIKKWIKNEAIAIGAHANSEETIQYFCNWADLVIDLSDNDKRIQQMLQEYSENKYIRFDIGGDRWGNPFHPELRKMCQEIMHELKIK